MDDLVCVTGTGGVIVAQASFGDGRQDKFIADAWKDDDFGFCTEDNSEVKHNQA